MSSFEPWNAKIFKEFSKVTKLKKIDIGNVEKICREKGFELENFVADKLEKFVFIYSDWPEFGLTVNTGSASPDVTKYDFPMFWWDCMPSKRYLRVEVDLVPLRPDDEDYREKYIEPIASVHDKYKDLSGHDDKPLEWWSKLCSPHNYLARTTPDNEQRAVDVIMDYFRLWLKFYKEAKTVKDPKILIKTAERKNYIKEVMLEKDPGKGPLIRLFGAEMALKILEIVTF